MTEVSIAGPRSAPSSWLRPAGFVGFVLAALVVYLFLASAVTHGHFPPWAAIIPPMLLTVGLLILNVTYVRRAGWPLGILGFDRPATRLRETAIGFGGGLVLVLGWALIVAICMGCPWQLAHQFTAGSAIALLGTIFFINASEELAYRGYLLRWLVERFGIASAVVVTSVAFFLLHVQSGVPWSNALAVVFSCSLLYGILAAYRRSVILSFAFHLANNIAQHVLGLRSGALTLFKPGPPTRPAMAATVLIGIALLNVTVAGLLWRRLAKQPKSE